MKKPYLYKLMLFAALAVVLNTLYATNVPVSSGGDIQAAISGASADDVIVLEDGGSYTVGSLTVDKNITIQAASGAATMPLITSGNWAFGGTKGVSLTIDGVEIVSDGEDYFISLSDGDSINNIDILNSKIHGFGRCFIRADKDPTYVDHMVIKNSHVYDFDGGGWRLIYFRDARTQLQSMLIENSTFDGFNETFFETKSLNTKTITINNCTLNGKIGTDDGNTIFNIDGGVGSTFEISNTLITNMEGTGALFTIGEDVEDIIKSSRFFYDESTYADTTNAWSTKVEFSKEDPQYADAANGDLTLPEGSALLTAGTDGGVIGDPRWVPSTGGGGETSLPDGAVVHWKFEGDINESLTGATGEIVDGPGAIYVDGPAGKAIDISGESDTARIVVEETEALKVMNISDASLTLSVLVKFDPAAVGDQAQQEIFIKGSNGPIDGVDGSNGDRYEMYAKNGGIFFVIDQNEGNLKTQLTIDQTNFVAGEWNHLVGVRDRENTMLKAYVNGQPAGEMADISGAIDTDTIPLLLGNYWNKVNKLHGALDEVVVFDRVLSPEEIAGMADVYGLVPSNEFNPSDYEIAFITDDDYDSLQIEWLEEKGFTVTTPDWPLTAASTTILNEMDLVIIGRSAGSSDLGNVKDVINNVNAPMLSNNQYGSRFDKLGWFNTEDGGAAHLNTEPAILKGLIELPDDEIFADVTLTDDSLGFFTAPHDVLHYDIAIVQSNATMVATNDSIVLIARFDPDVVFYESSEDKPLGHRTYFGFGNDNTDVDGADFYNYFPLTDDAKIVYFNEIKRLIGLGNTGLEPVADTDDATLSALTYDGTDITLTDDQFEYTVNLAEGTTAVPTVTYTTTDANATAVVNAAASVPGETTVVVTAADGTTTQTYTITFNVATAGKYILFVGDAANEADAILIDSLSNNLGYNVDVIAGGTFDSDFAVPEAYAPYDMVFISETIGSGDADAYGIAGMPVPCFLSEPFALNKTGIMFGTVSFEGAPGLIGAHTSQLDVLSSVIIEDAEHPITSGAYSAGQSVQVLVDAPTQDVWQYEMILEPSLAHVVLGTPDLADATNPADWQGPSWVVVEEDQIFTTTLPTDPVDITIPKNIEIIVHGFHGTAALESTPEYMKQVRRSVLHLLGDLVEPDAPTSAPLVDKLSIYPNPAKAQTAIDFTLEKAGAVDIMLLNLNGQLVKTIDTQFRTAGKNTATFNVSDLSSGMYIIRMKGNGFTKSERLLINN